MNISRFCSLSAFLLLLVSNVSAQTGLPKMILVPGGSSKHGGGYQYVMKGWQMHYIGEDTSWSRWNRESIAIGEIPSSNNPEMVCTLSDFYLSEHEVTNLEYIQFLADTLLSDAEYKQFYSKSKTAKNGRQDLWRELVNRALNEGLYPDTSCWVSDEIGIYNEPLSEYYFSHPAFDNYPVVGVSWDQAQVFCLWLTVKKNEKLIKRGHDPSAAYRLPNEAEWEHAARWTGEKEKNSFWEKRYPFTNNSLRLKDGGFAANFKPAPQNYFADNFEYTAPVKSYPPADPGLYDLGGNVAEWTQDIFTVRGDQPVDGEYQFNIKATHPAQYRVVKGGSWADYQYAMLCGSRTYQAQDKGSSRVGFRVAMTEIGSYKK